MIIPWHEGSAEDRLRNRDYLLHKWAAHFPEWDVAIGYLPAERVWNKGLSIATATEHCEADVLVVADADVWLDQHEQLHEWVDMVHTEGGWMVPHDTVLRLSEKSTQRIIEHDLDWRTTAIELARAPYRGVRGGGMFVIKREDYDRIGGIDIRFEGWGWEDTSFGYAADTLLGKRIRGDSNLIHFYHEPHVTRKNPYNKVRQEDLRARYLRARGFSRVMTGIVKDLPALKEKAMLDLASL